MSSDGLFALRWAAITGWVGAFLIFTITDGLPFDREQQIVWVMSGLIAASIGRRPLWTVVLDWLPFALVLIAYDFARGASDTLGMPVWWHPQIDVDKVLFAGQVPNVWLQAHFKTADARWLDVVVSVTYFSFFFLPYVTAGVFWLRSRQEFRRWAARFVTLSFTGFGLFAIIPAAPPWAAARCSAADVTGHPGAPACMFDGTSATARQGGLLGRLVPRHAGAEPVLQRISTRGWPKLHLHVAQTLVDKGQGTSNLVAAVPSLHAGGTMLFSIFVWSRANRFWRAFLVLYNLIMAFSLVYAGEHYVSDILAGWLCAAGVAALWTWLEQRRMPAKPADTLDAPPLAAEGVPQCPPTVTTPSST